MKKVKLPKWLYTIFGVIARFLAVILFVPTAMIYFMLFMITNPIEYIFTGRTSIAKKFHEYINRVIESNGL